MCGIAGWHAGTDVDDDPQLLQRMLSAIVHRGPDDEGRMIDGAVALGVRRLSIIDVAGGHQPIANEDRSIWATLNGEIYNFRELRAELEARGHVFRTHTDTEILVHAYEAWGDAFLARLNGIFGLAVWDAPRRRLLLARDQFGVKPLYYHDANGRLAWASEIKALLVDERIPRCVDLDALDLFLTFRFVPSPLTMFSGIRKIAPGHCLIKDEHGCRTERYFAATVTTAADMPERDWIALLQERLETAVQRQMMSDVPIGALLSGGIDSGAIVAIMTQLTSQPVRTFTVGFESGDDVNELDEARRTAAILGTTHHEIVLSRVDYQQMLDEATWYLDEPNGSASSLAMYSVCRLAREHVTVVLTGQGVDEPFAGYPRYFGERYGALYRRLSAGMRERVIGPLVERLPRSERLKRAARSLGTDDITERFAQIYALFSQPMKAGLWRPDLRDGTATGIFDVIDYWRKGVETLDPLSQMTFIDARLSLSDDLLTYGDKMSMAASIEARVPFLDPDYMRVVEALPASLKIRGRVQKYAHKLAVAKWLPPEVIRRRKRGFETPIDRWFRSELAGYVRTMLLSPDAACRSYFQPTAIDALIGEHMNRRHNHQRQLFSLLMFELWHRRFIDGGRTAVRTPPVASRAMVA